MMQVILLATDEATKLQPLTDTIPAPLLPITNRPVITIAVEILVRSGFKDLLVSLYQRGGSIASYCGNGGRWGAHIEYVLQRQAWGSAGALKWASGLLRETFLVLPADAVLDLDIEAAVAYHHSHQGAATLILHDPVDGHLVDPVQVDAGGRVIGTNADQRGERMLCTTGAYIFEPRILDFIPPRTQYDSYSQLLPALLAAGVEVYGYTMQGYWNPLNSFQAYQDAQRVFLYSAYEASKGAITAPLPKETPHAQRPRVRYPSIEGRQVAPGIWVGRNDVIHPGARLAPPICIGDGCWIDQETELGPEVVLGANVIVDDGATVYKSTILEHTYVGQLVNVDNRIVHTSTVIDPVTDESTRVVDPFLLAEARPVVPRKGRIRRSLNFLGALLLLVATAPFSIPIGLIAYLSSGGQVFQRLPRVGKLAITPGNLGINPSLGINPQALPTFDLLTFQTQRRDGTLTTFGRWLMRWELQRLPELWNVLRGDLALVGVKPLSPAEAAGLHEEWHQKRYECPVGFTGLWYLQTDLESDLDAVLVADAYYAATRTRRNELRILLQTPAAWLRRQRNGLARKREEEEREYGSIAL